VYQRGTESPGNCRTRERKKACVTENEHAFSRSNISTGSMGKWVLVRHATGGSSA